MNKLLFSLLLISSSSIIASSQDLAPMNERPCVSMGEHPLNGIFLTGPKTTLTRKDKRAIATIKGIEARNLDIPEGVETLRLSLEPLFMGKCFTKELVVLVRDEIFRYYRSHGRPVVAIDIPEQDITEGVLQIVITEGKLQTISTRGNRWYSDKLLKSYIRLKQGEEIDTNSLLEDVAWMNRNPYHHTNLIFTPGSREGTTDIELVTEDRFPLRLYVGGDNTGVEETGQTRIFGGFNWLNAFGCDQQLTYQATVSDNLKRFRANTINYVAPLPWRHIFQLYGGYATIEPKHEHFHSKGRSFQSSARYTMPIPPTYKGTENEWVIGVDYKNTNNNLEFVERQENPIIANEVNILQLMFAYNLGIKNKSNEFTLQGEVFASPGNVLPKQSNRAYNELRRGAKSTYAYGRFTVSENYQLPWKFHIYFQARGQIPTTTLLPSEQFGLGGYDTVRGYDEREANADQGYCGNFEIRTPSFPIFGIFSKKHIDELYFLAFADYGLSINYHDERHVKHTQQLASVGPGLRYRLKNNISIRADYGYRFIPIHDGQDKGWKVHLGALIAF
ncbi:MAG: ShlB/FhaC/HecB family hemolysin secretion/activation protein [Verrucomicrobia bacterium]|nr:ShlB/FhaC/HecB family hemolysin secretion/activation protein [Verrucomicrobiota bacterium]